MRSLFITLFLLTISASARTWETKSGSTFEGEMVGRDSTKVSIRVGSKVRRYNIAELSRPNQLYVEAKDIRSRTWTSNDGKTLRGRFHAFAAGNYKLTLKLTSGQFRTISLEALIEEDQELVWHLHELQQARRPIAKQKIQVPNLIDRITTRFGEKTTDYLFLAVGIFLIVIFLMARARLQPTTRHG